jgi:hypothetical protein
MTAHLGRRHENSTQHVGQRACLPGYVVEGQRHRQRREYRDMALDRFCVVESSGSLVGTGSASARQVTMVGLPIPCAASVGRIRVHHRRRTDTPSHETWT